MTPLEPTTGEGPIALDPGRFERLVLGAAKPVLVAFTADWCAPCKWLKPYLEELSASTAGRLDVFTLDIDGAPELAGRYSIGSVPTVVFFGDGLEVARSVGIEPDRLHTIADTLVQADPSA